MYIPKAEQVIAASEKDRWEPGVTNGSMKVHKRGLCTTCDATYWSKRDVVQTTTFETILSAVDRDTAKRASQVTEDARIIPALKDVQRIVNEQKESGGSYAVATGVLGAVGQVGDSAAAVYVGKRVFATGANRNDDSEKPDYEGYLSPLVLREYGRYMQKHARMEDGSTRPSDNWQRGIPKDAYMKSLWRHFLDVWTEHRTKSPSWNLVARDFMIEALCGIMFNAMGYLHEVLKEPITTNTGLRAQMERDIEKETK